MNPDVSTKQQCKGCRFSCQANGCECLCHSPSYSYGFEEGVKAERERILKIINSHQNISCDHYESCLMETKKEITEGAKE